MKRFVGCVFVSLAFASAFGDTYYVDADHGDDSWDGTAETHVDETTVGPRKTLKGIMEVATTSGDIVYAAAGTYDEETMTTARVVIPEGVRLESKEGAEKTFIVGSIADSLRCVDASLNASLVGFTLTGGKASNGKGGGVRVLDGGNWQRATIVDCIISNNYGTSYAGAHFGRYIRCRITGNVASTTSGVGGVGGHAGLVMYDCYVNGNTGMYQCCSPSPCVNTTIGNDGSTYTVSSEGTAVHLYNCVVLGPAYWTADNIRKLLYFHRVAVIDTAEGAADFLASAQADSDCLLLSLAEMGLDAVGRPLKGSSLIDAGSDDYYTMPAAWKTDKDLYGADRFVGTSIDIGYAEYDFKQGTIDNFGFVRVTGTTGTVAAGSDDAMLLANNAAMDLLWKHSPNPTTDYEFSASVSGAGTLSVYRDGSATPVYTVTAADGVRKLTFSGADDMTLRLELAGGDADSVATVSSFYTVSVAIISAANGLLDVTGASLGTNYVASSDTLSFTIKRRCEYPTILKGAWVNGEYRAFDDQPDGLTMSFTVTGSDHSSSVNIVATYETPTLYDWYVDATNGKDTNSGLHRHDAFKTLQAVYESGHVAVGETVWALPGRYDTGTMTPASPAQQCRVAIPHGTVLRSTDGAENTFIVGDSATRGVFADYGAQLRGFTVTDGYASNGQGGGIYCYAHWSQQIIADCIVSNNTGSTVAGVYNGSCVRCLITKNIAGTSGEKAGGAGGRSYLRLYDCYVAGNTGACQVLDPVACYNTTIGCDTNRKSVDLAGGVNNDYYNCVLLGPGTWSVEGKVKYIRCHRCAVIDTADGAADFLENYADADCLLLSAEQLALDADGVPAKTSSLVDVGTNSYHESVAAVQADVDARGVPRILNNQIDIGYSEYDWRKDYSEDLTTNKVLVTVTNVAPAVVETSERKVRILDGGYIYVGCKCRVHQSVTFLITVSGEGTLTASIDDQVLATFTEGDTRWRCHLPAPVAEIKFSFSGDGHAEFGHVLGGQGLILTIR